MRHLLSGDTYTRTIAEITPLAGFFDGKFRIGQRVSTGPHRRTVLERAAAFMAEPDGYAGPALG